MRRLPSWLRAVCIFMLKRALVPLPQEGDSVIIDVDADGQVTVLNGDKKMVRHTDSFTS